MNGDIKDIHYRKGLLNLILLRTTVTDSKCFTVRPFKRFNNLQSCISYLEIIWIKNESVGTSLAVQWLRLHLPMQGGAGLIPGRGAKIPRASQPKPNKQTKKPKTYNRNNIVTNSIKT